VSEKYETEEQRIEAVQAALREIREAMDPAWSGLADHPEMEALDDCLHGINNGIHDALMECQRFHWNLRSGGER